MIMCLYVVTTHVWITPRPHFDPVLLALYLLMGCGIYSVQAITIYCLFGGYSVIQAYNEMLNFERKLSDLEGWMPGKCQNTLPQHESNQRHMLSIGQQGKS